METDQTIYSDMPNPPGEYLEEVFDELGMTKNCYKEIIDYARIIPQNIQIFLTKTIQ